MKHRYKGLTRHLVACSDALLRALQKVYKSLVGIDAESVDATVNACLDATKRSVCVRVRVSLFVRAHAVPAR